MNAVNAPESGLPSPPRGEPVLLPSMERLRIGVFTLLVSGEGDTVVREGDGLSGSRATVGELATAKLRTIPGEGDMPGEERVLGEERGCGVPKGEARAGGRKRPGVCCVALTATIALLLCEFKA